MRDTNKGKGKLLRGQTTRQVDAGRSIFDCAGRPVFKTKFLSARQYDIAQAKKPAPVRVLSGRDLDGDFEMAECVLNINWESCKESHRNKLNQAMNDNNHHEPVSKGELVIYLTRKMGTFWKIINWESCKESHRNKLNQAMNDNNHHEPMSKGELVIYLTRKMGAFWKIINNLPKMESITTKAQMQAYIDDTEAPTKNLETYVQWKWYNQAVLGMGF